MTLTMLWLLGFQIIFGAIDNVLHHEITERLPARPSARRELTLHSGREAIYGILFLLFAWIEPTGIAAVAVLVLLLVEVIITLADFLEEDRTRQLPPFERVLHTILAISYGAFLLLAVPWLMGQAAYPSGIKWVDHGMFSLFLTLASLGVFGFAIRNALAARALGLMKPAAAPVQQSGGSVLVTGGTGFIGQLLVARLQARGDRVIVFSRDPRQARVLLGEDVLHVSDLRELPAETRIDAVVNLAGAPIIGLPWTKARRRSMRASRIALTSRLVQWLGSLEARPRVLVNASAIGFYGDAGDTPLDELAKPGHDFGASLCRDWEGEALKAQAFGLRVVCLRIGLVLDRSGGALPLMALPVRFGLGAVLGSGRQWMAWITRDDLVRMIMTAIDNSKWSGVINAVAPEPIRHAEFQQAMARTLRRPMLLHAPAWALRLGLGEMSSIFLASQRVRPTRAVSLGFSFDVHRAADALDVLLRPETGRGAGASTPLQSRGTMDEIETDKGPSMGKFHDADGHRSTTFAVRAQGEGGPRREEAGLQA
jgi:uncharacterized protein (TIGR01777 family)